MRFRFFGIDIQIDERGCILLLLLPLIVAIAGCDPPPKELQPGVMPKPEEPEKQELYVNNSGQSVIRIQTADLHQWLLDNKDAEIIALTSESINTGECNSTNHYLIVFKKRKP